MSPRFAKRSVALGSIAAALATILGSPLTPEHATAALGVLTRAVAYVTAVFGNAIIATQLMFLAGGKNEISVARSSPFARQPPLCGFRLC